MAYSENTIANADLFDGLTSLDSLFTAAGWTTVATSTSLTLSRLSTTNTSAMHFRLTRTGTTAGQITVEMSKDGGATYDKSAVLDFTNGATSFSGNVDVTFQYYTTETAIFGLGSLIDGNYYYNIAYLGYIARFDTTDLNAWGMYVSGAPELKGSNWTSWGVGIGTLETFLMRSTETGASPSATSGIAPFHFGEAEGWGLSSFGYNATGQNDNILTGSADYDGNTVRDVFEEEKFMASRLRNIAVYRHATDAGAKGARGFLRGIRIVNEAFNKDSAGNTVPKLPGKQKLGATVRVAAGGNKRIDAIVGWAIFPLNNSVKDNHVYNGLNVVAIAKDS